MFDISKLTETERGAYLAQMEFLKKQEIFNLENEYKSHKEALESSEKNLKNYKDTENDLSDETREANRALGIPNCWLRSRAIHSNELRDLERQLYFYRGIDDSQTSKQ